MERIRGNVHEDHPRIRGEHHGFDHEATRDDGIIPAYAGSTPPYGLNFMGKEDHPRIRGEHSDSDMAKLKEEGSSPHTRGAPCEVAWKSPRTLGSSPHTRGALRCRRQRYR